MTLVIRLSTPQGLVFCADSLVTTSEVITVVDTNKSGEFVPAGKVGSDSPPVLINPVTYQKSIIKDTKQNVDKITQILDEPIMISVAGAGNFIELRLFGGHVQETVVPFESFRPVINDVVSQALKHNPDMSLTEKARCVCFAYTIGAAGANYRRSQGDKFSSLKNFSLYLQGGGFSDDTPWPQIFDLKLNYSGQEYHPSVNTVAAAMSQLFFVVQANLPKYCTSLNWFKDFCVSEFDLLIKFCITKTSAWGALCMRDAEDAKEYLIPDLFTELSNTLKIISHCIGEFTVKGFQNYSLSDIIAKTWNLKRDEYHSEHSNSDFIDTLFEEFMIDNQEFIDHWMGFRDVDIAVDAQKEWADEHYSQLVGSPSNEDVERHEGNWAKAQLEMYGEKVAAVLSPQSLTGLNSFIVKHMVHVTNGSLLFVEDESERFIKPRQTMFSLGIGRPWFGQDTIGQDETVQRIVQGMDKSTKNRLESDVRDYAFSASTSLAEMVSSGLSGDDIKSIPIRDYRKYSNRESDFAASYSEDGSPSEDEGESGNLPNDDYADFSITDLPLGNWTGFYTLMEQPKDSISEAVREHFELVIDIKDGEKVGLATTESQSFKFSEILTDENGEIRFKMSMNSGREKTLDSWTTHEVAGHLTEWGFNGTINPNQDSRGSLIMWSGTKIDSKVGGSSIIRDSLGHLRSNIQKFTPRLDEWTINWENLALETSIELAKYLMESTVKKQHFNQEVPTVGGKIKIVSISPSGEIKTQYC